MNTLRPVIPVSPVACFSWFPLHGPHSFPIHLQSPATCKVAHYPYAPYASQPTSQPGSQSVSQTVSFGLLSQLFFSFRFCFLFSLLLFLTQIPTCLVACSALFLYAIVFVLTHKCSFIYIYVYVYAYIYIYVYYTGSAIVLLFRKYLLFLKLIFGLRLSAFCCHLKFSSCSLLHQPRNAPHRANMLMNRC